MIPNRQLADYQDILARLESADVLIEQTLALLKRGLKARATAAYRERIAPVYKALQSFLETGYLPNAVTEVGFSNLANDQAW